MDSSCLILMLSVLLINTRAHDNDNSTDLARRAVNRKIRIKLSGSMPTIEIERSKSNKNNRADNPIKKVHNLKKRIKLLRTGPTESVINAEVTTSSYFFDQILNDVKLTPQPDFRKSLFKKRKRKKKKRLHGNTLRSRTSSDSENSQYTMSGSEELYKWKDEWAKIWEGKKLEALNATTPRGDFVNMVAARPWGVPCGDPKQNPVPWGTCMLPQECESEFRIYRGDIACGRTQFICCGMQHTAYDFYNAFDASFEASEMKSGTHESAGESVDSKEKKKSRKKKEKKRRERDRKKRKKRIKRSIQKIVRQMKKILEKMKKRGDKNRKWKTKQLKNYVKYLKKHYKMDLESVKDIHENQMIRIDKKLMAKLQAIAKINLEFQKTKEFKDILQHGTMSKEVARKLFETYPDLLNVVESSRRFVSEVDNHQFFDYDIEYGFLYY